MRGFSLVALSLVTASGSLVSADSASDSDVYVAESGTSTTFYAKWDAQSQKDFCASMLKNAERSALESLSGFNVEMKISVEGDLPDGTPIKCSVSSSRTVSQTFQFGSGEE